MEIVQTPAPPAELLELVANVDAETGAKLLNRFAPFFDAAQKSKSAFQIIVSDEADTEGMSKARELRLKIRKVRTDADKLREALKRDALEFGKAVQTAYNVIASTIADAEEHLKAQEEFAERAAKARKDALRSQRLEQVRGYEAYIVMSVDLADHTAEEFEKILQFAKFQKEAAERAAAEAKARAEREAAEAAKREKEAARRQGVYRVLVADFEMSLSEALALSDAEFDATAAEAQTRRDARIAAEAEMKERASAEAKARAEREARDRAEQEAKARAERAAAEAKAKAERESAALDDAEKMKRYIAALKAVPVPTLTSPDALGIVKQIAAAIARAEK